MFALGTGAQDWIQANADIRRSESVPNEPLFCCRSRKQTWHGLAR